MSPTKPGRPRSDAFAVVAVVTPVYGRFRAAVIGPAFTPGCAGRQTLFFSPFFDFVPLSIDGQPRSRGSCPVHPAGVVLPEQHGEHEARERA